MTFPFDEAEIIKMLRSEPLLKGFPSSSNDELIAKRHRGMYSASCQMIMRFLGPDWTNSHIMLLSPPDNCFRVDHNDNQSHNLFTARVLAFADLLYNFQNVQNFEDRVDSIKNDGRGIESGIAELNAGCMFRAFNLPFVYVKRQCVKTLDYDIEYVRLDGKVGVCEVKCKIETTDLSQRAIYNSLADAQRQVPCDSGAVILLVIPERWLENIEASGLVIEAGVNEFFRRSKTSRISEVIMYARVYKPLNKGVQRYDVYRRFSNPHCADTSGIPPFEYAVSSNPMSNMPNWKSILDAVNKAYPRLGS